MIAAVLAFALATLAGFPLALRFGRNTSWGAVLGASFLLGTGILTLGLLALSIAHIRWSATALIAITIAVAIVSTWRLRWTPLPRLDRFTAIDILTGVFLVAYARYATAAPGWENDFTAIWGLKAKIFFLAGGIDWTWLGSPWHVWSHPDYPPLVPLVYDLVSLIAGGWNDRVPALFYACAAGAAVLIVRSLLEEETGSRYGASFGAFVLAFLVATPWIGIADGPLIAFALSGLLFLRSGRIPLGATLLGFAALTKNEGLTLLIAAAIALAIEQGARSVVRLWPAVAVPLPWLVLRAIHHLPTDLTSGPIAERIVAHLADPAPYVALLTKTGIRPWLWLGLIAAFALQKVEDRQSCLSRSLSPAATDRQDCLSSTTRFLLITAALQLAAYLAAYLVTPLDVAFHIDTSWSRLVWHLMPIVTFAALATVLPIAATPRSSSASPSRSASAPSSPVPARP